MSNLVPKQGVDVNGHQYTRNVRADDPEFTARSAARVGSATVAPSAGSSVSLPAGMTQDEFEVAASQYVVSALWTDTDDNEEPLDANYTGDDLSDSARERVDADLLKFVSENEDLVRAALSRPDYDVTDLAHDLWLTRNHHGTGFWDRPTLVEAGIADALSESAHELGEIDLIVGDDGQLHLEG